MERKGDDDDAEETIATRPVFCPLASLSLSLCVSLLVLLFREAMRSPPFAKEKMLMRRRETEERERKKKGSATKDRACNGRVPCLLRLGSPVPAISSALTLARFRPFHSARTPTKRARTSKLAPWAFRRSRESCSSATFASSRRATASLCSAALFKLGSAWAQELRRSLASSVSLSGRKCHEAGGLVPSLFNPSSPPPTPPQGTGRTSQPATRPRHPRGCMWSSRAQRTMSTTCLPPTPS